MALTLCGPIVASRVGFDSRYTYGGIYLDMDVEVVQPFDTVMTACPTAIFWEPRECVLLSILVPNGLREIFAYTADEYIVGVDLFKMQQICSEMCLLQVSFKYWQFL